MLTKLRKIILRWLGVDREIHLLWVRSKVTESRLFVLEGITDKNEQRITALEKKDLS